MIGWETEIRGNTERNVKRLYDMNGNHVGTISISRPRKTSSSGKKKKSALYSFKQVSSQVLQAKTSTKAMQVSNSIRAKIGLLKKQLKNGDVDEEELLRAILHAEMVMRACDKKKKNLKMEETAERNLEGEEEIPVEPEEPIEDVESEEEIKELEQEEFEALMEKLEMSADEMMEMAEETVELDEELDEMAQALSGTMTPEDLEQLKVKHRSDEARDILKADLKYLKALFDRLQSEKENAGKANFSGSYDSGVSLSLGGGMDMPVMTTQEVQQPDIGGSMDIEV
jgi:anti-sigma28 factor (negative regulator of flagellin synthesis)